MVFRNFSWLIGTLLVATVSWSAPLSAVIGQRLPKGLRLVIIKNRLHVKQQEVAARLDPLPTDKIGRITFDEAKGTITVRHVCGTWGYVCCNRQWRENNYTVAQLEARLDHARGLRLLGRKKHEEASSTGSRRAPRQPAR